MHKSVFFSIMPVIMILSIGMVFHTVEAESMSLSTNNDIYYNGDYIVAFGSVSTIFEEMPVTIQIYHDANLISVAQVPVAADGTYAATFTAVGNQWMDEGTYSIRSFYTPTILAESTFDFYNQIIDKSSAEFPVKIPNSGTFDVGYTIRGGEVKDIEMNMDRYSILVQVTMDTNGNLILKLPRESFDAQSDGTDQSFIILVSKENTSPENFMYVEYEDVAIGSDYRTIRIPLEEGDKWVEVIGTYIIPEFGSIVTIILIMAVSSIIIISKSKLSVKYN